MIMHNLETEPAFAVSRVATILAKTCASLCVVSQGYLPFVNGRPECTKNLPARYRGIPGRTPRIAVVCSRVRTKDAGERTGYNRLGAQIPFWEWPCRRVQTGMVLAFWQAVGATKYYASCTEHEV